MGAFAEFLTPLDKRRRALSGTPEQLTVGFDAGVSSRPSVDDRQRCVTEVRPSQRVDSLAEAVGNLTDMELLNGATVRAYRSGRMIAGEQREVVVVFSP